MTSTQRIFYVNGNYVPESEAMVPVLDRGFLFADAVYEVTAVLSGRMIDNDAHLSRLERSLFEIGLSIPSVRSEIEEIQRQLINRNQIDEGIVYVQISRGAADRDFMWNEDIVPTVVAFTQAKNLLSPRLSVVGARIKTQPDLRWSRRDIKTTLLLPQVLAKAAAKRNGADDTWMVQDGLVTEGSSTNAFIITSDRVLQTRSLSSDILGGVTREAVLSIASTANIPIKEEPFSVSEAQNAAEAFSTGTSFFVVPVISIDGHRIGSGRPGKHTTKLRLEYIRYAEIGSS